ncbi:hypothetical protein D3C83_28600 [compost metagenome]
MLEIGNDDLAACSDRDEAIVTVAAGEAAARPGGQDIVAIAPRQNVCSRLIGRLEKGLEIVITATAVQDVVVSAHR